MESILTSIKNMLGITEEDDSFDAVLIMHINSAFMNLTQLGVGPPEGYSIEDKTNAWSEFVRDTSKMSSVKSYIYLRVKLLFDPPMSAAVMESTNRQISEYEWRLNVEAENTTNGNDDNNSNNDAVNNIIGQIGKFVDDITATIATYIGGDSK